MGGPTGVKGGPAMRLVGGAGAIASESPQFYCHIPTTKRSHPTHTYPTF
jgi:hypothetical protein